MSEIKVNSIKGVSATSAAISINNTDGTCTANITNNLSNRNIIINGAMQVAQRGTSGTTSGYASVDRFETTYSGTDEAPTQSQHTLSSSDNPYAEGFRYSYHVTNGNQTSVGTSDYIRLRIKLEAQDLANSGWNYTSSSSYITLSFWVKASVTQTYYVQMRTSDGTNKSYYFAMNLSANTWTKVTHSISGHADISFDNDTNEGIYIAWYPYRGTNNTGSGQDANQWNNWDGSTITPDQTTTWYTTNDATFEITGVQLEVGSVATDFEHRLFADELIRCKRYYRVLQDASGGACYMGAVGYNYDVNSVVIQVSFEQEMRATPTLDNTSGTNYYRYYRNSSYVDINAFNAINGMTKYGGAFNNSDSGSGTAGQAGAVVLNNTSAKLAFDAEL